MSTATFTCEHCGTVTEVEYDGVGSYSQLFVSERDERDIYCRNPDCQKRVGSVWEY